MPGNRELEAETEMVMQLWEDHGGLSRHQITSIRRVQNMPLWTKYALTRAEIQASFALYHGRLVCRNANTCVVLMLL